MSEAGPEETRLKSRLKGMGRMHVDWTEGAASFSREERSKALNDIFDQLERGEYEALDFDDSQRDATPPRTGGME